MFTSYAPRVAAHPTRTGAKRATSPIRLLVVHTSEGAELDISAEALAKFIATPRTATNLASYHYIADWNRVIPIVPDDYVAYANAGANSDGLSICYPGRAGQSAAEWADPASTAQHEQVARWLADKSAEYHIPLVKLDAARVLAGARGVCGHLDVSLAYGRSTHTDPGPFFPWTQVIQQAERLLAPPIPAPVEEDDDVKLYLVLAPNSPAQYVTDMATFKKPIATPDVASEGVTRFGWIAQTPGTTDPFVLSGPGWSNFLDTLPTT